MRGWLAACVVLLLALTGCSTQEQRNEELVETYLQAIVDGRLADAALLHTSFDDDDHVVPREAYLAAEGRVDGFTIDEVTERAAQVTLYVGADSRSGTLHITQDKIWDTWVWSEMMFTLAPAFIGAKVNGVPMPPAGEVSLWAPAGSFEVTAEAGPLLTAFPRSWEFPLVGGSRGSSGMKMLDLRLTEEGKVDAGQQLWAMIGACQDSADPRCARFWQWEFESPEPTMEGFHVEWQRCWLDECPAVVSRVVPAPAEAADGDPAIPEFMHMVVEGAVVAMIKPDLSLEVEILGDG